MRGDILLPCLIGVLLHDSVNSWTPTVLFSYLLVVIGVIMIPILSRLAFGYLVTFLSAPFNHVRWSAAA